VDALGTELDEWCYLRHDFALMAIYWTGDEPGISSLSYDELRQINILNTILLVVVFSIT
jgi:hypothetical protein